MVAVVATSPPMVETTRELVGAGEVMVVAEQQVLVVRREPA